MKRAKRSIRLRLNRGYQFNRLAVLVVLVILVAVGIWIVSSHASQPAAALNTSQGVATGNVTSISDVTATGGTATQFGNTQTPQPGFPIRGVFYYPWFPGAWNQQGLNPFTHYHPTLGFYDSTDPNVINTHINAMIYAGFNTAIFSWWGQGSTEDGRFQSFLSASAGKKLKWAPYYECEGNNTGGACTTFSPSVAQITSDLNYIKTKYTSDPSYLKINSKPVIFVYGDGTDSCTTASNWKSANANTGNAFYVVLKVFAGYTSCPAQPDNWHQYGPAVAEDHQTGHSFTISPGFFKANESSPRLARDPNRWVTNITDLKNSNEPFELVTTFNEWGEGTSVESASEWASASGFGTYIDALHAQLGSSTGDNPPTVQITSPPNGATITGPTNLESTASDDHGVSKVTFYLDNTNTVLGTVTNAPYQFQWSPTAANNGSHTILAVATDTAGQTAQASVTVTVNVSAGCTSSPTAPTNLTATLASPTSTTVNLSWTASTPGAGCSIVNYSLARVANGSSTVIDTSNNTPNFSDTTAAAATTYTYTVRARDNAGNLSPVSNSVNITTPASGCSSAPAAPANFTAALAGSGSKTVNTSWSAVTPPTGCSLTGYNLYRNGAKIQTLPTSATSFADTTTNFNTTYTYSVTATDNASGANESAQSASKQLTTPNQPDTAAPDVPSGVRVSIVTPTQVTVSWNASADNPKTGGAAGTAGYKLFRDGSLVNGNITTTSANDNFSFVPNQSYSWTVEAFDAATPPNVSAPSTAVSAVPNPQVTSGGPCGTTTGHPQYTKYVWIWGENTGYGTLAGMKFLNGLAQQCGTDPQYLDNMFGSNDQVSEPHYIAGTGGSNCNTGLTPLSGSTGCRSGDSDPPSSGTNSISSIFEQINHQAGLSWKAYEEAMPKACSSGSSGDYAAKHNPPIFFQHLISDGSCAKFDISIPNLKCTSSGCGTPTGPLVSDIQSGALPNFSFVTPGLCNDMHGDSCGGNSAIFDQWLNTYVNLLINGPDYKSGKLVILVGWDESSPNQPQPNVIIAPSINKSKPTTVINHFATLRMIEQGLGLPGLDGCASGQTPGNVGTCPAGSTVDLRTLFNF